jgi:hypothetical protein
MTAPRCASLLLAVWLAGGTAVQAQDLTATASSDWGPGYEAAAAADGVAGESGNYWQTVQGTARGAWWQADLGEVVPMRGVTITWARYEDKVHAPPARVTVQVSLSGIEGTWQDVQTLGPDAIPRDEAPWGEGQVRRCPFVQAVPGRYVRLCFPEGDQPGARYEGYICLGEVEVEAPGRVSPRVTIEGPFGRAEVATQRPALVSFQLRGPAGLTAQSVLATVGRRPWARQGYTYVVAEDGTRYESRLQSPEAVETEEADGRTVLRLRGVKLAAAADQPAAAVEDWTLAAPGDGSRLVWTIRRRWLRDMFIGCAGSPGLFLSFDARQRSNSTTGTLWVDPLRLAAQPSALYALSPAPGRISENHLSVLRDRDTWAILKLWTNWHAPVDLRLEVAGGHLYRRGSYAWLSEVGAVTDASWQGRRQVGQTEEVTLSVAPVDKAATGYQLAVSLPDPATETALRDFYGSVLNGGAVNDQKGFDFGNETDGWYYAGSCWMYGMALAAGVPVPGALAAQPYAAAPAFREHLAHVFATVDAQGRACFGYNQGGEWVDDNLHTVIGTHAYLLHSGDLAFVRQHLPVLEKMLAYFLQRRNAQGLFVLADVGAHWYYDAITTGGVNGYYNAFLYQAALDLAEMEAAAGRPEQARLYREVAGTLEEAFNRVLWREDLPGGPRYLDWIDGAGREVAYFCDLCQWPAVAVGIASAEQARKIVATADARLAELEKENGYTGCATLSALWPVPPDLNPYAWQTYGRYMNGGSLLVQTYWEIMARCRAGDAAGAARRLTRFAQRASQTSWAGDNAADITGEMRHGDGEPYLADMVATTAALVHGVLGIRPTWDGLTVTPCLPPDWPRAQAEILFKGRRHRVTIAGRDATIEPLDIAIDMPLLWLMDFNLRRTPGGTATTQDIEFRGPYADSFALRRVIDDGGALGIWKLDEAEGMVQDASAHRRLGTVAGNVVRGCAGHDGTGKAMQFAGEGQIGIADSADLLFGPGDSFTVQCWFRTGAQDSRVMVGKPGAYCVYVKQGRLAAWVMQADLQFREALGSGPAADGQWHHVAAVYDRQAQRLALYLDGALDTAAGQPAAENPIDITPIGAAVSRDELTLGGLGASFHFVGELDEVCVCRGALSPAEFALRQDYPPRYGSGTVSYAASGVYTSPAYDWTTPARLQELAVSVDLHGGEAKAVLQASDDGFVTVRSSLEFPLRDGVTVHPAGVSGPVGRSVRARFELTRGSDPSTTPVLDGFRLTAAAEPGQ